MNHDCDVKKHYHEDDIELGYNLGIYPDDVKIHSGENFGWFISVGEYVVPIIYCPFVD